MQRAPQPALRYPHRSRLPWLRALLLEAQRSDLVVSIFKKSQNRNKRESRKGTIQLLVIILGALVVIVLGLYGGLASSHHH